MELIPIIYTVLEVAAVLTIITTVISLIVNKSKNKSPANEQNNSEKERHVYNNHAPDNKVISSPKEKVFYSNNNSPLQNKKMQKQNDFNKPKRNDKIIKNKRIEIINNISSNKNELGNTIKPKPVNNMKLTNEESKLKTLGDDILDKYSDNNEKNMYSLNVKKNKEN